MHGPIDYIVVKFNNAKFDGSILKELISSVDKKIIRVLDISVIQKTKSGEVESIELTTLQDQQLEKLLASGGYQGNLIDIEDIKEIGELLDEGSVVAMLVIEQIWAKGLKKAILQKGGQLVIEGRIHPDAAEELDRKGEK